MALTVTHTKVSLVADGPDTSQVRPSDWNASHTLSGTETMVEVTDVGTAANQVPLNQYLGKMAFAESAMVPPPSSATAPGNPGEIAIDGSYAYFCVSVNTWLRVAVATW